MQAEYISSTHQSNHLKRLPVLSILQYHLPLLFQGSLL